jgi:hypothetical protein
MRASRWCLSPPACSTATIRPSLAATGRGWAHPTSTGKRPAPGRRAGWPELQGHAASVTAGRPAMVPSRSGAQGDHLPAQRPQRGIFPGQGGMSSQRGRKIAERAGAERQPVGRETAPEGFGLAPWPSIGCGVGTRASRRTLAGAAGGAGGAGPGRVLQGRTQSCGEQMAIHSSRNVSSRSPRARPLDAAPGGPVPAQSAGRPTAS